MTTAPSQVNHKSATYAGSDAFVGDELHDVEEVTRVLTVECGNQFAAIEVFQRDHRQTDIR